MATIAPWLNPPNFLGFIEAGTQAGLGKRRADDEEAQFSAKMGQENQQESNRQDDAAQRLRLSYDSLAQQHDLSQQEIAARAGQNQAAMALREQVNDSLQAWRQQQAQNQGQKIADAERKQSAADALRAGAAKDTMAFFQDVNSGKDPVQSKADHPGATGADVGRVLTESLISKRKSDIPAKIPVADFVPPGQDAGLSPSALFHVRSMPINDPAINKILGTNAPAGTGTNYVSAGESLRRAGDRTSQGPTALPGVTAPATTVSADSPAKSPFKEGQTIRNKQTGDTYIIKNGQPVPMIDNADSNTTE